MLLNRDFIYIIILRMSILNKWFSSENIYIQHIKVYNNLTE